MTERSHLLVLNSVDKVAGTSGNFHLHLPRSYQDVIAVELLTISMPMTFYNIRTGFNNQIVFNDGTSDYTVTIDPGNYTASSLVKEIQTVLNDAGSSITFTVTYSTNTMKVTIAGNNPFSLNFTQGTCWRELGFTQTTFTGASSYTGPNAISLDRPNNIFINVKELSSRLETSSVSFFPQFVLNVNANAGSLSYYYSLSSFSQILLMKPSSIQHLSINLTDGENNAVDLNGSEWSMIWKLHFKEY